MQFPTLTCKKFENWSSSVTRKVYPVPKKSSRFPEKSTCFPKKVYPVFRKVYPVSFSKKSTLFPEKMIGLTENFHFLWCRGNENSLFSLSLSLSLLSLSLSLSIYLSTYLSIYLSIHPSIHLSMHLSIYFPSIITHPVDSLCSWDVGRQHKLLHHWVRLTHHFGLEIYMNKYC